MPPRIFHLLLFDTPHVVSVDVPPGDATTQITAATRQLTQTVTSVAINRSLEQNAPITCGPGCGACCRQLVRINVLEALALAELVAQMPPPRQAQIRARFAAAIEKLRAGGLVAPPAHATRPHFSFHPPDMTDDQWLDFVHRYFELNIACPFLEKESCSIYENRPLICREYMVTSPVCHCQSLDVPQIKTVPLSMQISERLVEMISANNEPMTPTTSLIFALEWAAADLPPPTLGDPDSALLLLSLFCRSDP